MITDIGIELGKMAYRNRRVGLAPVRGDGRKLATLAALVGSFFLGSLLGAAGYLTAGFPILIAPAIVLLAVATPPLIVDVRHRIFKPNGPVTSS